MAAANEAKTSGELLLKLVYTHHDHDYVERRGGPLLYTHMRGAESRGRYRRAALTRAHALYSAALADEGTSMRLGGLGLLVLQRAMLAAEDLGGLLHALGGTPPSFERLTSATYEQLDNVFLDVRDHPEGALEPFILPTRDVLEAEHMTAAEVDAAMRLVQLTRSRWLQMLHRVERLWLEQRVVAKATMHGIPLVAVVAVAEETGRPAWPSPSPSHVFATFLLRNGADRCGELRRWPKGTHRIPLLLPTLRHPA